MSQEKVEKYKQEKAHRKEIILKERRKKKATKFAVRLAVVLVCAGICGAVGLTFYNEYQADLAARPDYTRDEMVVSDLTGILDEDSETETATE